MYRIETFITNPEIKILEFINSKNTVGKLSFPNLEKYLYNEFNFKFIISEEYQFLKNIKRFLFHLNIRSVEIPKCHDCDNKVKWHQSRYSKFCSPDCSNKNQDHIKKIEEVSLKKYGVKRPSQSKQSIDKLKDTNLKKFGYVASSMHPDIKEKAKETCLKKYGTISTSQLNFEHSDKLEDREFIITNFIDSNNNFLLKKFMEYFNCSHNRLKLLSIPYKKLVSVSRPEQEIVQYIKSIYSGEIITNSRQIIKPLELDIFIPEHNIAIEFNGVYFHSYGKNNISKSQGDMNYCKNRHLNKTILCEEKDINLLHINENEWLDPIKQKIWKSIISNKLGISQSKIFARKTIVKEVPIKEARIFLDQNHIQGAGAIGPIRYGLYSNEDKLLSIMTFGKPRFNKEVDMELIRLCSLINYNIVGGASKLYSKFKKDYPDTKLLSYANRRFAYSKKNIYRTLGLVEKEVTVPNMFIVDKQNLVWPRQRFQKHKLDKIPGFIFKKEDTATQNKIDNGYRILWDSGNLKYQGV